MECVFAVSQSAQEGGGSCWATSELAEGPSSASAFALLPLKEQSPLSRVLPGLLLLCLINAYLFPPLPPDFAHDDDDVVPDGEDTANVF